MGHLVVKSIALLALPIATILAGAWLMGEISDRAYTKERWRDHAKCEDQKPLNQRLGYDLDAVDRHWKALDPKAQKGELTFLKIDLIFPLFYGAALLTSLLIAWNTIGKPFSMLWLIAPVAITVVADWIENLVQLKQLNRYVVGGGDALQSAWIELASAATVTKLLFVVSSSLFVLLLVAVMVCRSLRT